MAAHDMHETLPVTLFRYPTALGVPTADPHALAVECMLRFVGAHFLRRDAALPVAIEVPASSYSGGAAKGGAGAGRNGNDDNKTVKKDGLAACFALIEGSVGLDAEQQRPLALCVRTLVEKLLLPALVYIIHSDRGLFTHAIRRGVVPKVATFWQRLRGSYRHDVLQHSGCCGRYCSVEEALEEVRSGLRALETIHAAGSKSAGTFFLGTERPCSVDALAYAAASFFFHADFVGSYAPSALVEMQSQLKADCPSLIKYIEHVRQMYFEEYSAFYTLRAINDGSGAGAAHTQQSPEDEMFRKGRWMTIAWTVGFSMLYFLLANANVILDTLAELDEEEEEGADDEKRVNDNNKRGDGKK